MELINQFKFDLKLREVPIGDFVYNVWVLIFDGFRVIFNFEIFFRIRILGWRLYTYE